ncbi:FKBP-type peptidyl-prolyl cis-trans isomerase N-terminal domain-containing protein [Leclercia barmai]|uniref:FKBP-type peptidyl-prolyl cis-trans isomerase N-terminal domain-containing protein n=1 Tax=Leclercia barmai TaxID=2785629 RepID=UPI003BB88BF6
MCVADTTPRQLAAKDALNAAVAREKIVRLNAELQKANDHLASLNQQLAAVEQQKAALEKAATAQRERPAPAAPLSNASAQTLALESVIATLNLAAEGEKARSAQREALLKKTIDHRDELSKQLTDLQGQKKSLEDQLASLMTSSSDGQKKSAELNGQLSKATARSDELSKQLAELQGQKKSLEDRLAALKTSATGDQSKSTQMAEQLNKANAQITTLLKELTDLKLQKKEQEQQLASLMTSSSDGQKKSAELNGQLSKATARSDELSKQLAELQGQKKSLEDRLTALKSNSTGDKQKNIELTEKLNETTAQSTALTQQLAEMKKASSALDSQVATLTKQKLDAETALKNERQKHEIFTSQLEDAKTVIATQQAQLASLKAESGADKESSSQTASKLKSADEALANLKKQLEASQAEVAALKAKPAETPPVATANVIKIDAKTAKDTRTSYAVGTWYGDSATREKEKMTSLGKTLDLPAFMQGFNDSVNKKPQMTPDKLSSELIGLDKLHKKQFAATQSENEKQSKALMLKAAKEPGAVKVADGSVYRIVQKGETPLILADNELITELDEVLGTGKVISSKELRASRVKDLPPLFQTVVKKMGLGGVAKIHIPAKQAYGEAGVPGFVPPGTISIITIKIVGVK